MITLRINHRTTYRYRQPVSLGPHRLMLPRPLYFYTTYTLTQLFASFTLFQHTHSISSCIPLPLSSSYRPPHFISNIRMVTIRAIRKLSAGVSKWINYQSREDQGTQSPTQTLERGRGSCRDFAVLFVEAARNLGFGARIVSGYLYNPNQDAVGTGDAGSTHAWAEVYVPGAGWITFDPTNRGVGGFNLIPVAVARGIRQVMPVAGSFVGTIDAFQGMAVEVSVKA